MQLFTLQRAAISALLPEIAFSIAAQSDSRAAKVTLKFFKLH